MVAERAEPQAPGQLEELNRSVSCDTTSSSDWPEPESGLRRRESSPCKQPSKHTFVTHSRTSSRESVAGLVDEEPCKEPTAKKLAMGLRAEDVEPWQRFPHLIYGYRRGGTHIECLLSLFSLHNETFNAWTTFASIIMGFLLFVDTASNLRCSWLDFSPFMVALVGQTLHGPLSFGYHTFMCMSPAEANRWRKLDLTFILVLNTCASYALSYFTFGLWLSLLWTAVVGSAAALGIRSVQALQPKQQLDRRRIVGMIGLTSMGYYLPVTLRGLMAFGLQGRVWPELGIAAVVLGCHFSGALVYGTHWPQRHFPGVFDLAGFSHNLMHILCFTAYNCAYPYLSYLYSQRAEWAAALGGAGAVGPGEALAGR